VDCLSYAAEILDNERNGYWSLRNGFCLPRPPGLIGDLSKRLSSQQNLLADVRASIRVGVHWDTEVAEASHNVSQVLCSCAPIAFTKMVKASDWEVFARVLLEAAFDATLTAAALLAAQRQSRVRVFLTAIGGGPMGNRSRWIFHAMDWALEKHAAAPLDVTMVHFSTAGHFSALEAGRKPPRVQRGLSLEAQMQALKEDMDYEGSFHPMLLHKGDSKNTDSEHIMKAFTYFDANGDGVIDRDEFFSVLNSLDKDFFNREQVDKLLSHADADGDGEVHYAEFFSWLYSEDTIVMSRVLGVSAAFSDCVIRMSSDVPASPSRWTTLEPRREKSFG